MATDHDLARSRASRSLKRHGSISSVLSSSEVGSKYPPARSIVSTISYAVDPTRESRVEPPVSYEPTYHLSPTKAFPVASVTGIIQNVLEKSLTDQPYDPDICKERSKSISEDVKSRVKLLQLDRYKIICLVHIGQLIDQGLHVASRCLWDAKSDNFSSFEYRNGSLFANAMVFGIYQE